jgi:adenosylmethionine-8-amino-7-oxononanoate aminotransferase
VSDWTRSDASRIWHPYTQHALGKAILPVAAGKGAWLELEGGQKVLDAISSWWVNIHGHGRAEIVEAITAQAARLEHVIFAGFTHEPAARLAEILVTEARRAGARVERVFYSDNGSTAVEVALKMAYQFHRNRGENGRTGFIALRGSYHGDTLGAMAACDPEGFHATFKALLPPVEFTEPGDIEGLRALIGRVGGRTAAMIVEPLVQGAEGMRMYSSEYLRAAAAICRDAGILFICDEVFTGFYRTGTCFAFEQAGIEPDLICLSKGITGGFLPLAVTLATGDIFGAFESPEVRKAFLHGHSYTANPIACAAALASWKLIASPECQERIRAICQRTLARIDSFSRNGHRARALGTIGAVELGGGGDYFARQSRDVSREALAAGVLLRPLGNVLYAVPPYVVTDAELDRIYDVMESFL